MFMPHTPGMATVQRLEGDTISTLQTMRETIITLTFIATAIRIQVPTVTVTCGPEIITSVQMSWRFTMKYLLNSDQHGKQINSFYCKSVLTITIINLANYFMFLVPLS